MKIEVSKISEKGDFRQSNQDRIDYAFNQYGQFLAIVCDGMGGHPHGDLAAEVCLTEFLALFATTDFTTFKKNEVMQWLEMAVLKIRTKMETIAGDDEDKQAMGTTLSALLIVNQKDAFSVNVGDSRIYQYYHHKLKQLTIDQNLFNHTKPSERKKINESYKHNKNFNPKHYWKILTSALGPSKTIQIDVAHLKNVTGCFLLTTDGVHDYLTNDQTTAVLESSASLGEKVLMLVELATNGFSTDNLSLIALEIVGE